MSEKKSINLATLGVLGVGVVAYVALLVIQLLTWWGNGGIFNLVTLLILAQIALAWPFVGHLFLGRALDSPLNYAICFAAAVGVLAVSGNLGIPGSAAALDRKTAKHDFAERKLREDAGELKALKLAVDLAGAKDDEAGKKIREEIDDLRKSLSDSEKEELERSAEILKAKEAVARWGATKRRYNLTRAQPVNGLVALSAFAVLAGAMGISFGGGAWPDEKPEPAGEEADAEPSEAPSADDES